MATDASIVYEHVRNLVNGLALARPEVIVGYRPEVDCIILHYDLGRKQKRTVEVIIDGQMAEKYEYFFNRFCTTKADRFEVQIPPGLPKDGWRFFRFYI